MFKALYTQKPASVKTETFGAFTLVTLALYPVKVSDDGEPEKWEADTTEFWEHSEKLHLSAALASAEGFVSLEAIHANPEPFLHLSGNLDSIRAEFTDAIQAFLDAAAKRKKYDSIFTLKTYANGPEDSHFTIEGKLACNWSDACWNKGTDILTNVALGSRPLPSVEEFIAELPACPF